jgi:hypothetical protein
MHITGDRLLAMIFSRRSPAALALASILASGCTAAQPRPEPPRKAPTDEAFVRGLLEAWLVRRDVEKARAYLTADFFVHPAMRGAEGWPTSIRSLPLPERALRFAYSCEPPPPSRCNRLEECIRSFERRPGGFEMETMKVDEKMIEANPELRSRAGREVVMVSFMLEGCNLGTSFLLDPEAAVDDRVLTIFYLAG